METEASLLRQLDNPNLTANQRAELRCQLAREYEDTGQPEAARGYGRTLATCRGTPRYCRARAEHSRRSAFARGSAHKLDR
jgi:hypothetical protein